QSHLSRTYRLRKLWDGAPLFIHPTPEASPGILPVLCFWGCLEQCGGTIWTSASVANCFGYGRNCLGLVWAPYRWDEYAPGRHLGAAAAGVEARGAGWRTDGCDHGIPARHRAALAAGGCADEAGPRRRCRDSA